MKSILITLAVGMCIFFVAGLSNEVQASDNTGLYCCDSKGVRRGVLPIASQLGKECLYLSHKKGTVCK